MSDVQFRSITTEDVDALAGLFVECFTAPPWNEPWTIEAARHRLDLILRTPSFRGLVALMGNRPVAMGMGQIEGWIDGNLFLLQEMCVAPDQQQRGAGGRLLQQLLARVRDQDRVTHAYLLTNAGSDAEAFYLKRNFRPSARKIVLNAPILPDSDS